VVRLAGQTKLGDVFGGLHSPTVLVHVWPAE
jgi:hypothetical protein